MMVRCRDAVEQAARVNAIVVDARIHELANSVSAVLLCNGLTVVPIRDFHLVYRIVPASRIFSNFPSGERLAGKSPRIPFSRTVAKVHTANCPRSRLFGSAIGPFGDLGKLNQAALWPYANA
jgi:hypothetical protein